jgi:hypothetical protein
LKPVYFPITPLSSPWPSTCNCSFFNSRFGPACFGQGKRRAARNLLRYSPFHIAASILGLSTKSRLLLNLRHVPCNPIICNACSLPGNRRARSGFLGHSSAISGGQAILFPYGSILICRCVPEPWLVPSGRSYIKWRFPTLPGFIPCRSSENKFYVISFLSLQIWALWIIYWWLF